MEQAGRLPPACSILDRIQSRQEKEIVKGSQGLISKGVAEMGGVGFSQ